MLPQINVREFSYSANLAKTHNTRRKTRFGKRARKSITKVYKFSICKEKKTLREYQYI